MTLLRPILLKGGGSELWCWDTYAVSTPELRPPPPPCRAYVKGRRHTAFVSCYTTLIDLRVRRWLGSTGHSPLPLQGRGTVCRRAAPLLITFRPITSRVDRKPFLYCLSSTHNRRAPLFNCIYQMAPICTPTYTRFLWLTPLVIPNGSLIGSAVFAWPMPCIFPIRYIAPPQQAAYTVCYRLPNIIWKQTASPSLVACRSNIIRTQSFNGRPAYLPGSANVQPI